MASDATDWAALLAHLRRTFPLRRPLTVRRIPLKKNAGTTSLSDGDRLTICINTRKTWEVQIDTLLHEYAHAMELDRWGDHSDRWGKYHAGLYRAWQDWMAGR